MAWPARSVLHGGCSESTTLAMGSRGRSQWRVGLAGLINAHDHLVNRWPSPCRCAVRNVQQWVDDMRIRLREDPVIVNGRAQSLAARVWLGGFRICWRV